MHSNAKIILRYVQKLGEKGEPITEPVLTTSYKTKEFTKDTDYKKTPITGWVVSPKGGAVIYIVKEDNRLKWGISSCHLIDNFDKKLGTIICEGRINKRPLQTGDYPFEYVQTMIEKFIELVNTRRCEIKLENYIQEHFA